MPSGDTPHPTPVALITDGAAATIVGGVSRLAEDLLVIPVADARLDALPERAVIAVADPERAARILDAYAAGPPPTGLQVAIAEDAALDVRVLESLARYDAAAITPIDGAGLITLLRCARQPGTAAEWAGRVARQATTPVRMVAPQPAAPTSPPARSKERALRALARRALSHRPTVAVLGLAVVLASAVLALAAFPGNPAAAALVVLVCTLALGATGSAALGYRGVRRAANEQRRTAHEVGRLARRVRALEEGFTRIRAGVAGATASSAAAAVASREMLNSLAGQGDLREATRQVSVSVEGLAPRLAAVESAAASTNRLLADGVRAWDIAKLHTDLLNDQQALAQLFASHPPDAPLPPVSGWAMNPTGLLWLVDHVERARPRLILECGSGTSTVWLAMALRRNGSGRLISVDHDPDYTARTRQMLERHGLSDWAEVRCCPLVETATSRGGFRWYDLDPESLDTLDLLVVDGPPGATGPHARYPAMPVLGDRLARSATVVLDDTGRREEQEVLGYWLEDHPALRSLGEVARGLVALSHEGG